MAFYLIDFYYVISAEYMKERYCGQDEQTVYKTVTTDELIQS